MPLSLTLAEKCYLVALFGDVPMSQRDRLFGFAAFDPASGVLIGRNFIGQFDDGRFLVRVRPSFMERYKGTDTTTMLSRLRGRLPKLAESP